MKRIIMLLTIVFLVSCASPFDKYKDSMGAIQDLLASNMESVGKVQTELTDIQNLVAKYPTMNPNDMSVNEVKELNNSLASINAELQAGNMDLLLSQAATYPEETKEILDQVKDYKLKTAAAILNIPKDDPDYASKTTDLNAALDSAEDIVEYFKLKGLV